jgi:transposase
MLPTDRDSPLLITRIVLDGETVILEGQGATGSALCPSCGSTSASVHDRYVRQPLDLPWRGHVVRVRLTVRRFRCLARSCPRRTFTEPFGPHLARRGQRTAEADTLLVSLAYTAGGEGGARLARAAGVPTSPDTLLRLLRRTTPAAGSTPHVLGVDDFALRRGHRYGTILVDLELHEVLDLLLDRTAASLADWLRSHPGVEIIVRDRAGAYADGARAGAPDAVQVADRFHLVKNGSEALDEVVRSRRRRIEYAEPADEPATPPAVPEPPLSRAKQEQLARRERRRARWQHVRDLRDAGASIQGIARETGMHRRTVRHYLATGEPLQSRPPPRPAGLTAPLLQPWVGYLQDRWQQGCHNVAQLFRELEAQGYPGSRSLLQQALQPWRPPRPPRRSRGSRPRRHQLSVRWLCLRPPDQLADYERQALDQLLTDDPELATGYRLLQRFRQLIATRDQRALDGWLDDAEASSLPPFVSLAHGIRTDRAAVDAALTTAWSNGQVEGQVHRLKLIKRQGYGRAKLDLLARRVRAA